MIRGGVTVWSGAASRLREPGWHSLSRSGRTSPAREPLGVCADVGFPLADIRGSFCKYFTRESPCFTFGNTLHSSHRCYSRRQCICWVFTPCCTISPRTPGVSWASLDPWLALPPPTPINVVVESTQKERSLFIEVKCFFTFATKRQCGCEHF